MAEEYHKRFDFLMSFFCFLLFVLCSIVANFSKRSPKNKRGIIRNRKIDFRIQKCYNLFYPKVYLIDSN